MMAMMDGEEKMMEEEMMEEEMMEEKEMEMEMEETPVEDDKDMSETCCCCCPIKYGIIVIAILTFVLCGIEVVAIVHFSRSAYFDNYFWIVNLYLLIPLFIAVLFFAWYLGSEAGEAVGATNEIT